MSDSSADGFKVYGRGELHLAILIENMCLEGYELAVSKPQVVLKTTPEGNILEPMEKVIISVSTDYSGSVINKLNVRKGIMIDMDSDGIRDKVTFSISTRELIGFRTKQSNLQHNKALTVKIDNFLSDTFDNLKIKNENMMGELVRLNKRYFQITLNLKQEMDKILSKAIKLVENKYHDHLHILFSLLVEYYISLNLAAKIKDILKIIGMTSRVI